MTPHELRETLERADRECLKMGLDKPDGLSLVIVRDSAPAGYKIRTPFGNCDIMNCQEINGKCQTVFRASRKQIEGYLKRCDEVSRETNKEH